MLPPGRVAGGAAPCQAVSTDLCGQVETQTMGTVTHMPPELLMEGLLTKAGDVWAFGVLMWWVQQLAGSPLPPLPVCAGQQAYVIQLLSGSWCSRRVGCGAPSAI